ncbi:MAG: site-2 protease family protein [Deltaproteobacteria bacterium]|nr:site-2 protease family protein [Deltaproteobacteria bacterium]
MGNPDHAIELLRQLALWSVPLLLAVIAHEVAHGVVALRLGDDTAQRAGRLTLNPLPHIDPIGTVMLPAILLLAGAPVFGYAKPVPVNYANLREPRRGMVLVALAGPLSNVALAVVSAVFFRGILSYLEMLDATAATFNVQVATWVLIPLGLMAKISVQMNVVLGIFNLLPIPPLDGGHVLTGLLPYALARRLAAVQPFGFMILMLLLMTRSIGVVLDAPVRLLLRVLL